MFQLKLCSAQPMSQGSVATTLCPVWGNICVSMWLWGCYTLRWKESSSLPPTSCLPTMNDLPGPQGWGGTFWLVEHWFREISSLKMSRCHHGNPGLLLDPEIITSSVSKTLVSQVFCYPKPNSPIWYSTRTAELLELYRECLYITSSRSACSLSGSNRLSPFHSMSMTLQWEQLLWNLLTLPPSFLQYLLFTIRQIPH